MKDYKKTEAQNDTYTVDFNSIDKGTNNIYESLSIIAKRANQISVEIKEELSQKIEGFSYDNDSLDEIFENNEQIEVSKFYERLPKATLIALNEWEEGEISYKYPKTEEKEKTLK